MGLAPRWYLQRRLPVCCIAGCHPAELNPGRHVSPPPTLSQLTIGDSLARSFGPLLRVVEQSPFAASKAAQVSRLTICATLNKCRQFAGQNGSDGSGQSGQTFPRVVSAVPLGGWPTGAGESPALRVLETRSQIRSKSKNKCRKISLASGFHKSWESGFKPLTAL